MGQEQIKHEFLNWEFQLSGSFQKLPHGGFRQSVRIGDMKAVRYGLDLDVEVFDLKNDESETINIAEKHPEIVEQAEKIFLNERKNTNGFPYGGIKQNFIPFN